MEFEFKLDSFEESEEVYLKSENFPMKKESFEIIGICMVVHRILGKGLLEIVYKDVIEHELRLKNISYEREKQFKVEYKGIILPHCFYADFVINNIIVEIKAQNGVEDEHYGQVINYLAVSKLSVGLLVNFGENFLKFKRFVF